MQPPAQLTMPEHSARLVAEEAIPVNQLAWPLVLVVVGALTFALAGNAVQ
jgi:hypothetical protein